MPTMQTAHVDRALTNMSIAYMQDASKFVADKVFPIVPVTRQSDIYYTYDIGDFLRDEAQARDAATESAGGDYAVEHDPYYCKKHAFHKDVTPEERANYDEPLNADRDAMTYVTNKMLIRRETIWQRQFFAPGVWSNEITGVAASPAANQTLQWQLEASNPIADINGAVISMAGSFGYKPNKLILSPAAFVALSNHPDILDRIKYTQRGIVTEDLMATLFGVDQVLVSWAISNKAVKGAADDIGFIAGNHALLVYAPSTPALQTPSAGYIFSWSGLEGSSGFGVRIVRLPLDLLGLGTERIEGEIAFDARKISDGLAVFFKDIVA